MARIEWFPSFETVDLARFRPAAEWMALLECAGFLSAAIENVTVRRQVTMAWLAAAVRQRYISTFDLIPDAEFDTGLARLEAAVAADPSKRVETGIRWCLLLARSPSALR